MGEGERVAAVADFGGTNIRTALITESGQIIGRGGWPADRERGARAAVGDIVDNLFALAAQAGIDKSRIAGLGVGVGAIMDGAKGYVYDFLNLGWRDLPMAEWLSERSGLPALIEMDAHAAALGEAWRGAGQACRDFILLIVGTGIGAGLYLDGRIYRGHGGLAGEFGHVVVHPDGPPCGCGRYGCLEALASGLAIAAAARTAIERNVPTTLQAATMPTAADVIEAARAGDGCAIRIIEQAARYLGIGISNLILGLSPALVLLGGGVILNGADLLLPRLRAEVDFQLNYGARNVARRIELAALGEAAGLFGAAYRVFEQF